MLVFPVAERVDGMDLGLLGQEGYGACYVVRGSEGVALVEVGTSLCVPRLLAGLAALGVAPEEVTHILCTHVHLDHAGAAGHLLEHCPAACLVLHSRSHRHLVEPAHLMAGVAEAVGEMFPLYGEVRPVSPDRLLAGEELRLDLGGEVHLEALPTPGHSRDHLAYYAPHANLLFTGDAAGVSLFGHRFLRPVTAPPAFDPPAMRASIAAMRRLRPAALGFTHFGRRDDVEAVWERLEDCLGRWEEIVRTAGLEEAAAAVRAENTVPEGTPPEWLWRQIAEMNVRGFLMAYSPR